MPFPLAPVGARRILSGWRRSGWVWCCEVCDVLDVWPNEEVQRVQFRVGGGPVREGYKVVALLREPSLGLFRLVDRRRVLLSHPGSAIGHLTAPGDHHTLQHIQVHFGVDLQDDFKDVRWHDVAFRSKTFTGSSDALSSVLARWTVRICILRVLAMVLLS